MCDNCPETIDRICDTERRVFWYHNYLFCRLPDGVIRPWRPHTAHELPTKTEVPQLINYCRFSEDCFYFIFLFSTLACL